MRIKKVLSILKTIEAAYWFFVDIVYMFFSTFAATVKYETYKIFFISNIGFTLEPETQH